MPEEYSVFRKILEREREKLTIDRLRTEVRAQYDLQKGWKIVILKVVRQHLSYVWNEEMQTGRQTKEKKDGEPTTWTLAVIKAAAMRRHPNSGGSSRCTICEDLGHKWYKCSKLFWSIWRETGHDSNTCNTPRWFKRMRISFFWVVVSCRQRIG